MDKFSVIDIGSNAVRVYLARVDHLQKKFEIYDKIRIPLRLGTFVFTNDHSAEADLFHYAENVFKAIARTLTNQKVKYLKAVATSALRDFHRGDELRKHIWQTSGINIEIIDGETEAELVYTSINNSFSFEPKQNYVLFDIGGGSIELSSIKNGKKVKGQSFNLGTVRLMNAKHEKSEKELKKWMDERIQKTHDFLSSEFKSKERVTVLGTGGNCNRLPKVYHQLKGEKGQWLNMADLTLIYDTLSQYTYLDRISLFEMRPDRADVITYALELIILVLNYFEDVRLIIPKVGLGEGVFYHNFDRQLIEFAFSAMADN